MSPSRIGQSRRKENRASHQPLFGAPLSIMFWEYSIDIYKGRNKVERREETGPIDSGRGTMSICSGQPHIIECFFRYIFNGI
ncbi:unnamed protein product [Caenorhabditis nigoni]